jgi:hypothetical protein
MQLQESNRNASQILHFDQKGDMDLENDPENPRKTYIFMISRFNLFLLEYIGQREA